MAITTKPKLDLTPFCDDDISLYTIGRPWRSGKFVYATDGRIAIRVDGKLSDAKEPEGRVPDCAKVIAPIESVRDWDVPPKVVDCRRCRGVGLRLSVCETCDGVGWIIDRGKMTKCDHGDGEFYDALDEIDADDRLSTEQCDCEVEFAGRKIGQWFVNLIRNLPDTRMGVADKDPLAPVYFRFAGGCGVLMPRVGEDD